MRRNINFDDFEMSIGDKIVEPSEAQEFTVEIDAKGRKTYEVTLHVEKMTTDDLKFLGKAISQEMQKRGLE